MNVMAAVEAEEIKDDPKVVTIYAIASDCLKETDGDVVKASALMVEMLRSDAGLLVSVVDHAIGLAIKTVFNQKIRNRREAVWSGRPPSGGSSAVDTPSTVVALARGIARSLYDFPLAGGVYLGDATGEQVLAQVHAYRAQVDDLSIKRKFLSAVAEKLAPFQIVRKVLSEEDLIRLKSEAMK